MPSTHFTPPRQAHAASPRRFAAALALAAACGFVQAANAAEVDISGSGSFKPPSAEQLAALPADLPFSRADLATGTWSFVIRYEDSASDVDPDPYVGRYARAIRLFRVTVGGTTVDLPVAAAELSVSDGGGAFRQRETVRLETTSTSPAGILRAGWIQLNQKSKVDDVRGAAGVLPGDALPSPSAMANLATSSPFDRYFYVRVDAPDGARQPLLYLASSQLTVAAASAAATR